MSLLKFAEMTEDEARQFIEQVRWPNGPECPHCGHDKAYELNGEAHRPGLYKCAACRKQFTVTVGTVMHRSHITLKQWLMAFHLICSSKKGISALQLQRNLGLGSYKTAWHLAHRIRYAMKREPMASMLAGTVEVDETYIGGKPPRDEKKAKRGRGTKKTPVVALVERDGDAYARPVTMVNAHELKGAVREMVDKQAVIMTDEWKAYTGLDKEFGGHKTVKHSKGEFSRGKAHVNTAESYFALLKRGVHGAFHHVSKEHLERYCDEFSFRWNHRKVGDVTRTAKAVSLIGGKRLVYKSIVSH